MYFVRNKSLDDVFAKYKTTKLMTLSNIDLENISRELNIGAIYDYDDSFSPPRRKSVNKIHTIEIIEKALSADIYIDRGFWRIEQEQRAEEFNLLEEIKTHSHGFETFELMARVSLGISNLKPGETQEIDAPLDWIESILVEHPLIKRLEVKDENGHVLEYEIEYEEKEGKDKVMYKTTTVVSKKVEFVDKTKKAEEKPEAIKKVEPVIKSPISEKIVKGNE